MVQKLIHFAPNCWYRLSRLSLLSLALLSPLMLSSCLLPKRKVQVQVKPVERAPLDLPPLAPLQLDGMNWYVVTESNFADIMAKLKSSGMQPVIFSLDEKGYENLSVNMTKIRGYITQQKTVIVALKDYYNVPDNPDRKSTRLNSSH